MSVGESYYRCETIDGCCIVTLLPELNDKQWSDIDRVGSELESRLNSMNAPKVLMDLSQLSYMGSAMVALIVRLYKVANNRGGKLVVLNTHELVLEVLKLAGLTKLWTIVDSREQAFDALGMKSLARRSTMVARDMPIGGGGGGMGGGGNGLLIAAVIGAVGAIIGLAIDVAAPHVMQGKAIKLIEFAFAALGMVAGTMILANYVGTKRNIGIAVLAVCLLVVLGSVLFAPDKPSASAPPAEPAKSATSWNLPAGASIALTRTALEFRSA